jgi:hypothetical protein
MLYKSGDVFEFVDKDFKDRYVQLIGSDPKQLNSEVIAVSREIELSHDIITVKEVDFCAHVDLKAGVDMNVWKKMQTGTLDKSLNPVFKDVFDDNPSTAPLSYEQNHHDHWQVWSIHDTERKDVGSNIDEYPDAYMGLIYPPEDILYRIKNNRYPKPDYFGQIR